MIKLKTFAILTFLICFVISAIAQTKSDQQIMAKIQGAEYLQTDGKFQEAVSAYENILQDVPANLKDEVLMKMAWCYNQLGNDNLTIQTYLKIVFSNPNSIEASSSVSLIMNLYTQRYQFEELLAMSKQITQQFPGTESAAMAIYRVASYLYSQGKTKEAIKEYENFSNQFPESTMRLTAINRLVSLYISEGMFKEAEQKVMDNLARNPDDTYMIRQLAFVYRKQNKYDEALSIYQRILSKEPDDVDTLEQIGELYAERGDKEKAIAEWSKITKAAPGQYYRYQMLASILNSHGFYEQAAIEYKKAIKLQPQISYLYTQLAELYIVTKQFETAVNVYLDALIALPVNYPDRSEIIESMLELYSIGGLYESVVSRLKSYMSQTPDNITIILTLADIYFRKKNFDDSLQQFRIIASLYPDNGRILFDRAQILEREQQFDHAIKFYKTIQELFSDNPISMDALMHIGQLEFNLNRSQEAVAHLQMLISKAEDKATDLSLSALILIGDVYLYQVHDIQSAIFTYTKAKENIDSEPENTITGTQIPYLLLKIGECYRLIEQYDVVNSLLNSIPERYLSGPIGFQVAKLRGDCFFSQGDFDNAKIQYKEAIRGSMNEEWVNDALDKLALIDEYSSQGSLELLKAFDRIERLKNSGHYDEALAACIATIRKYASSNLKDRIQFEMGDLLSLQMKDKEAISVYEELFRSGSLMAPEAQFRLAGIYWQKLNNPGEAIKAYTNLIEKYPESILVSDARKQIQRLASEKVLDDNLP